MSRIMNFFDDNSFNFNDENAPQISPNNVLSVLQLGIKNYYESYQADAAFGSGNYFYKVIPGGDPKNTIINPVIGCSHNSLATFYSSISYVQLFFELYVVELLETISPMIVFHKERSLNTFIETLLSSLNEEVSIGEKTESYSTILKRLDKIFKTHERLPENLRIPQKYSFLEHHIETLWILQDWRNRIMHSGKQVLFMYSYELLFVNLIFPLIKEIVTIEKNTIFMNRRLYCDLNVIEEINKIKLPLDCYVPKHFDKTTEKLNYVNHLKELGRASFNNPLYMDEKKDSYLKNHYKNHNERKQNFSEIEASSIHEPLNYFERFICPCCGTDSLMTFDFWTETATGKTRANKAKCLLCTYKIEYSIEEPKQYGIMNETVFNLID